MLFESGEWWMKKCGGKFARAPAGEAEKNYGGWQTAVKVIGLDRRGMCALVVLDNRANGPER
jgi:hypothetical protein